MRSNQLIRDFLFYLRCERGLSESTIQGYHRCLSSFLAAMPVMCLGRGFRHYKRSLRFSNREDVHRFLGSLSPAFSDSTRAHYFSALRQFFHWMQTDYKLRRDPMLGMKSPHQGRILPKALSPVRSNPGC